MVLVFGFAATVSGPWPTRIVAVTFTQPLTAWTVPRTGYSDGAAAVVAAVAASPAMATVITTRQRWVNLMTYCLPASSSRRAYGQARVSPGYAWLLHLSTRMNSQ